MSIVDSAISTEFLAREAYAAYGSVTDFKNYQGLPMPKWEELPPKIQSAWLAAATRIEVLVHERKA